MEPPEPPSEPKDGSKKTYRDSVFVDLFGRDVTAKANFLSLYNALHGTALDPATTDVKEQMLENVLYTTYHNDVAMLIEGSLIVLVEHQSTVNKNMPLRLLDYVTRVYERLIPARSRFRRGRVEIPRPEFYVLYNGRDKMADRVELRLSESFATDKNEGAAPPAKLELVVEMYNINNGHNKALQEKCAVLREYSEFVALVREKIATGVENPLGAAIREALRRGILADYLARKAREVENMFLGEYDYDTDIAVQREEAREEGRMEGREEGREEGLEEGLEKGLAKSIANLMQTMNWTMSQAMDALAIRPDERAAYRARLA